ncbi:MAG: hypothetical protein LBH87_00120, partial [Coriobacteriales bacterium]|nr:hypothetical protein [Coriobacteriales bacterium]
MVNETEKHTSDSIEDDTSLDEDGSVSGDANPGTPGKKGAKRFRFLMPFFHNSKKRKTIGFTSIFLTKTNLPIALEDLRFTINDQYFKPEILVGSGKYKKRHVCLIRLRVPVSSLHDMSIHNSFNAFIQIDEDTHINRPVTYNVVLRYYVAAHGRFYFDKDAGTTAFFRQTVGRSIKLTVRHQNHTDSLGANLKLYLAWILSVLYPFRKPILFFEKNASKFEESASEVFKYMINQGKQRIFYVIARDSAATLNIDDKYRKHFIY